MSVAASVPLNKAKVTEEFGRVLEQIFKRSLSTGDTSPYRAQFEAVSELEITDNLPVTTPAGDEPSDETLAITSPDHTDGVNTVTNLPDDTQYTSSPESDDLHKGTKQSSTGTSTVGTLSRKSGHVADNSSNSSEHSHSSHTSTKKKKSFFKKARERVRESFKRRSRSHQEKDSDIESGPETSETSPRRHKRKQKKHKENGNIGRTYSDKSRSSHTGSLVSPGHHSLPAGILCEVHTHTHTNVDHKLSGYGDISGHPNILHSEKTHQSTDVISESDVNKHREINFSLKESHPAVPCKPKAEKERNFLDTLRKLLKRRKSGKLDKGTQRRTKSADDIQIHGVHPVDLSQTWINRSSQPGRNVTRVEHHHVKSDDPPLVPRGPGGRRSQHIDEQSWQQQQIDAALQAAGDKAKSGSYPGAKHCAVRGNLNLPGLHINRPQLPANAPVYSVDYDSDRVDTIKKTKSGNYLVDTTITKHQSTKLPPSVIVSGDLDFADGATLDLGLSDSSVAELGAKPFEDRTAAEKDKVYSIIADKLNLIADHYNQTKGSSVDEITSPAGALLSPGDSRSRSRSKSPRDRSPHGIDDVDAIKKELAQCLRYKGDNIDEQYPEVRDVATELAVGLTYSEFEKVADKHVKNEPDVQSLANFVTVAKSAMKLVGVGGALAQGVKEMTLRYFEDKFAEYVFNKGGWESVVEDIDSTDPYSELD